MEVKVGVEQGTEAEAKEADGRGGVEGGFM